MAEARQRSTWQDTAALLAQLHNVNCSEKSELKSPADFPFSAKDARPRKKLRPLAEQIRAFKSKFLHMFGGQDAGK